MSLLMDGVSQEQTKELDPQFIGAIDRRVESDVLGFLSVALKNTTRQYRKKKGGNLSGLKVYTPAGNGRRYLRTDLISQRESTRNEAVLSALPADEMEQRLVDQVPSLAARLPITIASVNVWTPRDGSNRRMIDVYPSGADEALLLVQRNETLRALGHVAGISVDELDLDPKPKFNIRIAQLPENVPLEIVDGLESDLRQMLPFDAVLAPTFVAQENQMLPQGIQLQTQASQQ